MSVVKRFNPLLNLDELDVLIDDINTSSHIVITDMPQSLPQGKSSFLIETGPYMAAGVELKFDFIDGEGNSIYLEPVADYLEGTSRRISVEVYNDTAPGPANLVVVGELDEVPTAPGLFSETEPVPEEFQGVYNVRLTREVIINPVAVNTQPIRFYTQPLVSISERRLGTMERTDPPDKIQTSAFSVEGVPADGFAFKEFSTEEPKQGALAETNTKIIQSKGKTGKFSRMKKSFKAKKGKRKFSFFKRAGHIAKFSSPEQFPFSFKTTAHSFSTKEIDGSIILSSIDSTKYNQDQFAELKLTYPPTLNNSHTMSIEDIQNSATAFVTKPFTQTNADGQEIILPFFGTAKTLFEPPPTASYSTVNVQSYADVSITNMRTFSGDVFKAKVFVRPEGSFDDFKVLAELPVEAGDLLVDANSVGRGERTGYYENQTDINTYWEKFGGTNGLAGGSTVAMNFDNNIVLDAVKLSGSLATFTDQMRYQLKSDYKFQLKAGLDYNLTFTAYGKKGVNKRALLIPYISGSSMYPSPDEFSDSVTENKVTENSTYGKRLGALEILTNDDDEVDFKSVTTEFVPDRDGDAIVQFRNVEGEWYLADISVSPATDTGFSPSFFTFEKEMPSEYQHKRPETFEFMVEFYDPNNNIADSIAFNSGSVFDGANSFMSGNDNTMAGSLFIGGESTASGMHFGGVSSVLPETGTDGATGSGFMRSVGYQGFISASNPALAGTFGFMIYSGSVLPDSGDNYAGVGLELIGASGSLKFRTNPSVFEVQADAFFVGKTTTQFISGSGGAIEISSSGFHVTPEGNVTASAILLGDKANEQYLQFDDGQLTVQGNLSVNQIFTPATIAGNPSDVTNASSSITPQGFAKFTSASIAGFEVNSEAILSSNKNLILSQSGQITGSTVLFSGGKIANWDITGDKLQSINSSDKGILLDADASTPIIEIRENDNNRLQLYHTTNTNWGLKGISGGNTVFRLGDTNEIAGWTIGQNTIQGGNLILGKQGFIKSADYITDTSGFIISSEENGFAEFENVKIRGTLATTTFEKESVNAVGGQLFIANSAAITGSNVPATASKMTLKNVTGFAKGEILIVKKVGDTGFNTEYVKVVSSSRTNAGGDDDPDGLAGDLFVERGQGYYVRANKNFVANNDSSGVIETYTANLPLVYVGSGQNYDTGDANGIDVTGGHTHSGSFHVYITGSVTQVGDGTGLSLQLLNNSNSDSVIGQKQFWDNSIGTGDIQQDLFFDLGSLSPSPTGSKIKMVLRAQTDGTDDSYLTLKRFSASLDYGTIGTPALFGDQTGSVGDPIGGPESYTEGQVLVSSGRYISGTGNSTVGTGYIRLNANPKNKATPYMDIVERTGSGIYDIELKARIGDLSGVAGTRNVPEGFTGFGVMSEVAFLSGSQIKLEAPTFLLGDKNSNFVSGSGGKIEISSSKFHVKPDGDIVVRKVNADDGTIGGFNISSGKLASTSGNFIVSGSGGFMLMGGGVGDAANRLIRLDARADAGGRADDAAIRFSIGHADADKAPFQVNAVGALTSSAGQVAGFKITTSQIASSNNNVILKAVGNMTASAVDVKGDIKAATGFLQDIQVSGVRIAPANDTGQMRFSYTQTADAENFGPRSGSAGGKDDNVATGDPFSVENWWSGAQSTHQGGNGTSKIEPNTTGRPYVDFSNWGWKFKVSTYSNTSIKNAIDTNSSTNMAGWELLEAVQSSGANKWSSLNDGMSFSWGHTLAAPGYDGPKDETGATVSHVGMAYYPMDMYPGPTDGRVWSKSTGIPNVIHRVPPIVGGSSNALFDPESRFVGFDNYPQSEFPVHADSGSADFSPVFCFYTGSGIVSTYLEQDGSNQVAARDGGTGKNLGSGGFQAGSNLHFSFISPMIEQTEFIFEGATLEMHVAPLIKFNGVSAPISMTKADYVRYINAGDQYAELLIVERAFSGSGFTSSVVKQVRYKILPSPHEYGNSDTADHWSGASDGRYFFGWTKLSMNLGDVLNNEMANNTNRFQIVINFHFDFDKSADSGLQDSGYAYDNLPTGLKGWAMTELRITKDVSTSVTLNAGNLKTAQVTEVGQQVNVGVDKSDGFDLRGYLSTKSSTGTYFNISSGGSSVKINTQNRPASSTGHLEIEDVSYIRFTNDDNDLGTNDWIITAGESDALLRFRGPNDFASPSARSDYLTFVNNDFSNYSDAAIGTTWVNVQKHDLDFVVSGDTAEHLIICDASEDKVGFKTDSPAYVVDVSGGIRATGNITAYSDIRVKENIKPIENALFKVTQLEGVTYDRIDEDELDDLEGTQMGLIAQQVEPIVPEIVEIDKEGMYNLNYGNLAGLFVESIKELKQEVDDLKKEIQELKNGNSK